MSWIKKDDHVYVLAGNDKGKTGVVLQIKDDRALVKGINIRKKHLKKTQTAQSSQIIDIETSINISNLALCDKDGNKIKVKVKKAEDGSRDLVYLDSGKEVVYRSIKKIAK
jgi:large subunit ribosomal protein L24